MLTKRRIEILDFIINFKNTKNQMPTVREICKHFGFKSTNGVYEHLKALERDGYLDLESNKARNISLKFNQSYIPLLGEVPAGSPLYPVIEEGEYLNLPIKLSKGFLLKVKGDSMIKAGINDGDMVLVERDQEINNNSIVVALIDGEVTLKRIFFDKDVIELRAENDKYPTIKVKNRDIKVLGKATTLIRKL